MRGWIPVSSIGTITLPIHESISELEAFLKEDVVQYQPGKKIPITDITGTLSCLSTFAPSVRVRLRASP
jgi:hypothetical protein